MPTEGMAIARLALDAAMLRHQAIASNIANVNNPGYVPLRVNFEEQLASVAENQRSGDKLQGITPFIEQESKSNGLTPQVALDMEIVKLNMNTLHYQALLRAISRYTSIEGIAITEGRR